MSTILSTLEPKAVFHYFAELAAIPHGSGNTAAASAWAMDFAKAHDLPCRQDEAGNVVIWKKASPGYEDHPAVILQGHLDMVCVSDSGVDHDFTRDPLELVVEDGFVKARGTTLGGDNGIAVAMAMAVLADNTLVHPPIVAVFTTDEETGLLGANALDCSDLNAKLLLNLDSEDEGVLTVSCAGGARCDIQGQLPQEKAQGLRFTAMVHGLQGGHSGMEINKGLANGNKLLGDLLHHLNNAAPIRLISLLGGHQDNAIPKESTAVFLADSSSEEAIRAAAASWLESARNAFPADPGLELTLSAEAGEDSALSEADTWKLIALLDAYPNGVLAMSRDIDGLVETSLNLGILRLEDGAYMLSSSIRSSVAQAKADLAQSLRDLAERFGAQYGQRGDYPAWEFKKDSPLRETMIRVFREQYGREPVVEAIHAGLECGLFAGKIPGLDAVSFGPDLRDVHSPRERMDIASVARTWTYLLGILAAL